MDNSAILSTKLKFIEFCNVLESVSLKRKANEKCDILKNYIQIFRDKSAQLEQSCIASFYPCLRLMLPQLERERNAYGVKEKSFGRIIIRMLCLDKDSKLAKELTAATTHVGDFSSSNFSNVVYKCLKPRFHKVSDYSIADINNILDKIAECSDNNESKKKDEEIFSLFNSTSAFEQKWLIRIILKEMRLGMGQDRILRCLHEDAVKLYESNSNLSKTCAKLRDPTARLHEISISMFDAFNPMLSMKCDKKQFNKCVVNNTCQEFVIENKFDGERFQLHMENGLFKYFSRRGFEYSHTFGSDYSEGIYSPLLKGLFKSHVKSVILDGEMMGWNTRTKQFASKGMNFDVKKLTDRNTLQPCFCVFDVVYLNGRVITSMPLVERKTILNDIITEQDGIIIVSKYTISASKEDVLRRFNESVDKKDEGIVFKKVASIYSPNDRNGGWFKMKLEFFDDVMSDLDLLIMGGYYGQGRHRNKMTGFLLGVGESSNADKPKVFLSIEKISLGLSDKEIDELNDLLQKHWRKVDDSGTHENFGLFWGKEQPQMWIEPQKSCILQVRSSELVRNFNNKYRTRYSLRFARIQKIRADKPYFGCLTTSELDDLTSTSKPIEKLDKRHLELSDFIEDNAGAPTRKRNRLDLLLSAKKVQPVGELNSTLLEGKSFVVFSGEGCWNKSQVEKAIIENGGNIHQDITKNTYCVLAGDPHLRTKTYQGDIVHVGWLREVLNEGTFRDFIPGDMLKISDATQLRFESEYDCYGDSFVKPATHETLDFLLKKIKTSKDYINYTAKEQDEFYNQLKIVPKRNYYKFDIYFDRFKVINDHTSQVINDFTMEEMDFNYHGGCVQKHLELHTDYILTKPQRVEEVSFYLAQSGNNKTKVITSLPHRL